MDDQTSSPMALGKNPESPESGICLTISYNGNGVEGSSNAIGSPFPDSNTIINNAGLSNSAASYSSNDSLNSLSPTASNSFGNSLANASLIPFPEMGILDPTVPPLQASRMIEAIQTKLRNDGYSESALSEITAALNTLAYYGMLGPGLSMLNNTAPVGFSMGMSNYSFGNSPLFPSGIPNQSIYTHSPAMSDTSANPMTRMFNPIDNLGNNMSGIGLYPTFASSCAEDHFLMPIDPSGFDPFCQNSPAVASPSAAALPTNNNSFGLGTSSSPEMRKLNNSQNVVQALGGTKIELEVRENIVGAILGPGGKSLVEIQRHSGANIQISKKGIFAPGTRNRIVSITGMPNAVYTAQCLIEHQIGEEETKRAQRNAQLGQSALM